MCGEGVLLIVRVGSECEEEVVESWGGRGGGGGCGGGGGGGVCKVGVVCCGCVGIV